MFFGRLNLHPIIPQGNLAFSEQDLKDRRQLWVQMETKSESDARMKEVGRDVVGETALNRDPSESI